MLPTVAAICCPSECYSRRQAHLRHLPDPVVILDDARVFVYANLVARELLGCRVEGGDLALSVRHPSVLDAIGRLREGAESRITKVSFPVPVKQTFEMHAINVSEKSAAAITHVLLFRDVTQTVRAKTMRVNFVANASHELRSPLAALLGFVATIKESAADVPDAQKQFLDIMERGVHRMRRLIDDLLSRSRVEANEHVRPRGLIDITIALRVSIETLQVRAVERDMEIAIDFADGLPEVIGNPD